MTDKLIMTTAQRDGFIQALMGDGDANEAIAMLQSLPMVDSEPVAWMNPDSPYSVMTTSQKANNEFQYSNGFLDGYTQPLYTSPQTLTE